MAIEEVESLDYLDVISDSRKELVTVSWELAYLGRAFGDTGNSAMAKDLGLLAQRITEATEAIGDAVSREITASCARSEASAKATVMVALGVCGGRDD